MKFIIQDGIEELSILMPLLKRYSCLYPYEICTSGYSSCVDNDDMPIGEIGFVQDCLSLKENPIEIPKYLRTEEFLKRDYKLVSWKDVPRRGRYFLKDVSNLKAYGKVVNAEYEITDELWTYEKKNDWDSTLVLDKNATFLVSSLVNILAEYRVYVFGNDIIENICCYNGDCTILPDIALIKKAVSLINYNEDYLRAYTIDVAVTTVGTVLLEVHNFTSCGLYSTLWGSSLLSAYRDGILYLRNDNHKLEGD